MGAAAPQPPRCRDEGKELRYAWRQWAVLALWGGAILFWIQFAIASWQELEPQASFLGWTIVGILVIGGLAFFGAQRNRPPK